MRSTLVLAAALALPLVARAQSMTSNTPQTCTGMLMGDPIGLAFPDSSGNLQSINNAWTSFTFNNAECQCATTDLALQLQIKPSAFPTGTVATNQMWVGQSCDNFAQRTTPGNVACTQVMTGNQLGPTSFNTGAQTADGLLNINIPARQLMSAGGTMCPSSNVSNQIFVYAFLGGPSAMPDAECTLNITEQVTPPSPAVGLSSGSGDSAVTVSWQSPPQGSVVPYSYQILCSDACGNPVAGVGSHTLGYSVCLNGVIHRRPLPTASSSTTTSSDDGGTTETPDLMPASVGLGGLGTEATPVDGGTTDAGGCAGADLAGVGATDGGLSACGFNPFATMDPAFLCSEPILAQGTGNYSSRVGGLVNGQTYFFTVVAIDQAGNPASVCPVSAVPQPSEDLYRRLYADGAHPHGFCFVATAAFGSYESRYVKVLRDFRDEVLLSTEEGRAFVDWYYENSPPAAEYIREHRGARIGTQLALWPVIGVAAFWLYVPWWLKLLALAALVARIYRREIRRAIAERARRAA